MPIRSLEQKIYPLASYLAKNNIGEYLDFSQDDYISELTENAKVSAEWGDALRQIDNIEIAYKISNLPNTPDLCQLFFYYLDYYLSCNRKDDFDFLLQAILKGFFKFSKKGELDHEYIITSLKELNVKEEYVDYLQEVILTSPPPRSTKTTANTNDTPTPSESELSKYFKLISLRIVDYKNIKNISIDFTKNNGITLLIGNNGCGKSNIIEAISSIFSGLYKRNTHKKNFNYDILYSINNHFISIKLENGDYTVKVDHEHIKVETLKDKKNDYLPKNIIACYSGESERLFEKYYWPHYKDYIKTVKNADTPPELPLIYINKHCWSLALLTLFLYDFTEFPDIATFCTDTLKIKEIKKATLSLNLKILSKWKANTVITMVKNLIGTNDFSTLPPENIELSMNDIKERLKYMSQKMFFETMYAAFMPKYTKVITDIKLDILLKNSIGSNIEVEDLSEGERKYLLMRVILEVIGDENSLLLFDEPDAHIHISRKEELKNLFLKFPNRENILTTHSPTLAICFDECNIESLGQNEKGEVVKVERNRQQLISDLTNGMWNAQEQNMFLSTNKNVILLVEGKTDKTHINNALKSLKDEYPGLDFDIFVMNGESFVTHTIIGLCSSDIMWRKKVIGILDNDDAGNKAIRSGFKAEKNYQRANFGNKPSDYFFVILLPKPKGHTKSFTIENCYDSTKYESAFLCATKQKSGHFNSSSIDEISNEIKNKSKTIMATNSNTYNKTDFNGFKPLFDIINKINKL